MAGVLRCRVSWRSVLSTLLLWAAAIRRRVGRLWKFLLVHHCGVSIALSVLLVMLNIAVYSKGCAGLLWYFGPVQLRHGYMPVFPSHFFHRPIMNSTIQSQAKYLGKDTELSGVGSHDSLAASIPPVVHVVWCDVGPFTFTHYLSVLASFKVFSPSVLYLHLAKHPELDPHGYFQFLPDLLRDLPMLVTVPLKYDKACSGNDVDKTTAYLKMVGTTGGYAINGRTVVAPSSLPAMLSSKITIVTARGESLEALVIAAGSNVLKDSITEDDLAAMASSHTSNDVICENVRTFSLSPHQPCAYVDEDIFPVIIFNGSSGFDQLARWVAYGTRDRLVSHPANREIVPNIVHYVWLGERKLDFFAYLSLLSSLYVLKADMVYIHGDHKPLGNLWARVEKNPRVHFINRDFPQSVFGEPIERFVSHASDYLRADLLLRYGGVYADWDVLFLKELPDSMRRHNTTVCVDWPETGAFPDVFNLGVMVSAPGAPFLRNFLESYRWYLDHKWSYNAIHMPYKVFEKQPSTLNLDRHLQILCAEHRCHATWMDGYKQDSVDHLTSPQLDWHKDALAIHWTHPDPVEFSSQEQLLASHTVAADIGKHVLRMAKLVV